LSREQICLAGGDLRLGLFLIEGRHDADSHALSAIRVMGPCIAMGAAAAHALDLAGRGSVHSIDLQKFQHGLRDNLDRKD